MFCYLIYPFFLLNHHLSFTLVFHIRKEDGITALQRANNKAIGTEASTFSFLNKSEASLENKNIPRHSLPFCWDQRLESSHVKVALILTYASFLLLIFPLQKFIFNCLL